MVEPRGSEKVRRPKFLICPPPDGTFSLFFPSLSSLYLLYFVFAILLCCLTLQYFAVHPLSDRLSGYTLHASCSDTAFHSLSLHSRLFDLSHIL